MKRPLGRKKPRPPLDLLLKNTNSVRKYTILRHPKRVNRLVPYISAWGSLMWYFGEEKEDIFLADMLAECTANVSSTIIVAISGLYKASFFYLRLLIEFSVASFYFKERNRKEANFIPRWKELGKELNRIECFKKYNDWCIKKKIDPYRLTKLERDYQEISKWEVHFPSEVIRWRDVSPFYRRSAFCTWSDIFVRLNQDLLFMWLVYFISTINRDLNNDRLNHIFLFRDSLLKILGRVHKDYLKRKLKFVF